MKKLIIFLVVVLFCYVGYLYAEPKVYTKGLGVDEQTAIYEGLGNATIGRAVTATLHVSPNGDNTDGSTWAKAYTTIQGALDTASTDGDDCTLILISPHATNYDINTTGDPTWSANVILKGSHRLWAAIKNTHASATSVMKFTGKASIEDLAIFTQGSVSGVIFTKSGFRVRHCGFNSESTTGATKSIHLDGSSAFIRGGIMDEVEFRGNVAYTTALYLDTAKINRFECLHIHNAIKGIQIVDADSDYNTFINCDIGDSALAIDIDGGNEQHFNGITLHHNTTNIEDAVKDHIFENIRGQFEITVQPDNFTGFAVAGGGGADTWGTLTEVMTSGTSNLKPFRIVATQIEADASEKFRIQFTVDGGATYYDDIQVEGSANAVKRESTASPSGTEYIFNVGSGVSARVKSESGGDNVIIWIERQEI